MRLRRLAIVGGSVFCVSSVAFALYVITAFSHLKKVFLQQTRFVPTRLYSDVSRIAPPQLRSNVEERLQSLAYVTQTTTQDGDLQLAFNLHPRDYPYYLIPDNHPALDAGGQPVTLHFDGSDKDAPLRSIELAGKEIPDLYLEPELVATLTQSGVEGKRQIRNYLKYDDIPSNVWKAIVAIEDQHFWEHWGLDPRGLARAMWVDLRTRSFAQGGSTITLQLVKNLMERKHKNPVKKLVEFFLAPLLETAFTKQQILERYLNEVNLGQVGNYEVRGVDEGAELFFGKHLKDLNLGEIALMAGLVRGNAYYSPYKHRARAFERQRLVLQKMVETGQIAQQEADEALKLPVRLAPPITYTNKAPYFADFVKAELIRNLKDKLTDKEIPEAALRVYTTLDMIANAAAQRAVGDGISKLEARLQFAPDEKLEGALAAVDPSSGFIRALVGGRNYGQSTFNRILNMKRQIGSTFKPVVYLTAFLKGFDPAGVPYAPAHPAEDTPWTLKFDHGRQEWTPKNYEKEFLGWIDFRAALAHSINTVAARLGVEIGLKDIVRTARALGITSELPEVPSLSLGIAELSPVELLRCYEILADHGVEQELTVIRGITEENGELFKRFVPNPATVIEAAPVDLLTDMMQSVFTEGTAHVAQSLGFDRPAAGKTGTTSNHRDSWFAGYTPQLASVVWVGMDQMHEPKEAPGPASKKKKPSRVSLTGATSALPIWTDFMKGALAGEPPQPFAVSPKLVDVTVDRHTGRKATPDCPPAQTLTDKFMSGYEPRDSSCEAQWPASVHETTIE